MPTSSIDSPGNSSFWQRERDAFPACKTSTYLMSASTGPLPVDVYQAYLQQIDLLHEQGGLSVKSAISLIADLRQSLMTLLDARSIADVSMTGSTSLGMNTIAMMLKERWPDTKYVLMPIEEFPSAPVPFHHHGLPVKLVPAADLVDMLERESSKVGAVLCSFVQFSVGYKHDLHLLGEITSRLGIPFVVNATQGLGAFPLSVQKAKISALTASGHKWLCGGYGLSIFYTSPEFRAERTWPLSGWLSVENPGLMSSAPQATVRDTSATLLGTLPYPQLAGLNAAVQRVLRLGLPAIAERLIYLSDYFVEQLKDKCPGLTLITSRKEQDKSAIVALSVTDADGLADQLENQKILVTARRGALRISPHYFNNEADIDQLIRALQKTRS